MNNFTLIIGNKNYSSWSLRPWVALRYFRIPFDEVRIALFENDSKQNLAQWSPSGLVPVLKHNDLTVWDSLAIGNYISDIYQELAIWPNDQQARAIAYSVSAEMHAGFAALRENLPMNCRASYPNVSVNAESQIDINRICEIWNHCRSNYGQSGPFLFGKFSWADAMYAPVVSRFHTYKVSVDQTCKTYINTILNLPAMQEWYAAGQEEKEVLNRYEFEQN